MRTTTTERSGRVLDAGSRAGLPGDAADHGTGQRLRRGAGALLLLALGGMTAPGPAVAQVSPDTLVLTLDRAMSLAEGRNPTYRRAVNSLGLNTLESRTTWLRQVLPNASLTLFDTGFRGNLSRRATDNFGNPIEREKSEWVYFSNTRQNLNLSWTLQGRDIFTALDRQENTNFQRELDEEQALTDLHTRVRRFYYDALEQRDLLRTERELVASRERELETTNRLFSLARKTRVDVLNAELEIEQQRLAARQQAAAFEQARLRLRTQLGDPDLPPIRLAEEPLPVFDPAQLRESELVEAAMTGNPDMRLSAASVEAARLGVEENRNQWFPSLSMQFNAGRTAQNRQEDALFDVTVDEGLESNFSVGLSFPMFNNYFQNRQAQERAAVELENQRESLRETRLQAEQDVRSALLALQNQYETLRLAERSADIAEETLRLAREEYRLGTRTFEQLRQSIDDEASIRRQVITARHGFVDALLDLEDAVGGPVRPAPPVTDGGGDRPGGEGR